jgi:hypothetical protein
MADVFISYSKTRGAEAAELAAELGDSPRAKSHKFTLGDRIQALASTCSKR